MLLVVAVMGEWYCLCRVWQYDELVGYVGAVLGQCCLSHFWLKEDVFVVVL